MRKNLALVLTALLIISLLAVGCSQPTPPAKPADAPKVRDNFEILMGSGPAGAITDALYGAVFEDFKKIPYLKGGPTTGAPAANVAGVAQGKYNIAHSLSDITGAALDGTGFFKDTGAISGVSNLVTWWPMVSTLVVWADSPYYSLEDLKGKKVTPGPRMGSNDLELQRILEAMGMSYADFNVQFLGFDDAQQQMLDGQIEALLYAHTSYPHGALLSVIAQKQVRFLPIPEEAIDKVVAKYKGVEKAVLPAGIYTFKDGTKNEEMLGVGGSIHWLVKDDFPEDVAYDIVKSITENFERYQASFNNLKWMKVEDLAKEVPGVELHPGSMKYFKERGFIK
jgi:TRAP transporter TAXI family solute receptor